MAALGDDDLRRLRPGSAAVKLTRLQRCDGQHWWKTWCIMMAIEYNSESDRKPVSLRRAGAIWDRERSWSIGRIYVSDQDDNVVVGYARKRSCRKGYARQQCVYEGPYGRNLSSAGNPTLSKHHVDRQTGCEVMAIFVYPRWPLAAILDFIDSDPNAIRSTDPENPGLWPNMKWIGCTVCENRYIRFWTVLWPWNWASGSLKVIKSGTIR